MSHYIVEYLRVYFLTKVNKWKGISLIDKCFIYEIVQHNVFQNFKDKKWCQFMIGD